MTLRPRQQRVGRRWVVLLATVLIGTGLAASAALAVHDVGGFELDKNASNNTNISGVGYLASNINSTATSINICETATGGGIPATGSIILIEAERMTVSANNAGSFGGNCAGTKRTYTVVRGAGGTGAAAHSGGAQKISALVSLITAETKPGPDWNQVHAAVTADALTKCTTLGLVECAFIHDGIGPSIFTQGSTKDHLPLEGWRHTSGASPDKGEIINAYAAKAIVGGDQILYFGMDRYAVDGSTDIGFWFFKDEVRALADGTFSGSHKDGDILILGTFTQGGATTTIRIYKWSTSANTVTGPEADGLDCVPTDAPLTDDEACATVNDTTVDVPWNYTFKGAATGGWIPAGGFFEGGVNLSDLGLEGCFSSFLAETRSSPEISAILKDFALGGFEACETGLTTTPANGNEPAVPLTDSDDPVNGLPDILIGSGSVQVKDKAALNVTGVAAFTGTLRFWLCGPITTGTCDGTTNVGVEIGSAQTVTANGTYDSAAATVTSVGRYCWRGVFTSGTAGVPNAVDARTSECFEVKPVTPGLSTSVVTTPVDFGQAVQDNASISGLATQPGTDGPSSEFPSINATNGAAAGGKITFTLLKDDCTTNATGTGTNPQDANVTGVVAGAATIGPVSFTPDAPGTYHWKAVYSPAAGDPNNTGKTHNADCLDTNERVVVSQAPTSITTRQFVYPQDKAQVTATGGGALAGNIVFKLYDSLANCTANGETGLLLTDGPHAISGASPQSATTGNTKIRVSTDTTVYWRVTYVSTNQAQLGSSSVCVESTAVDFSGDDGTISIP